MTGSPVARHLSRFSSSNSESVARKSAAAFCHGFVRFVLKEDRSARPFSFAPLQGDFTQLRPLSLYYCTRSPSTPPWIPSPEPADQPIFFDGQAPTVVVWKRKAFRQRVGYL